MKITVTLTGIKTTQLLSAPQREIMNIILSQTGILLSILVLATQANMRLVEKKIIDDILGSKAYDSRIRPQGQDSKSKLQEIFCHRGSSTWSWKRCQFATSDKEPFGELEGGREVFKINEQQSNLILPFLDTLTCEKRTMVRIDL